ncbi:MAG: sugar ABC transporter substrate-binding protein [Planctomycetota bacterium]|nr:sugar ABC transporter substrate-binding protein [Planctomycetota bacterium]
MNTVKLWPAVVLGAVLGFLAAGCGGQGGDNKPAEGAAGGKTITLAYVGYSSTNAFWNALADSAAKTAQKAGVKFVDLTASKADMALQKAALDNAILKKVDGLVVGAVDSRGLGDTFDKAKAAGIPIVTVDTRVDHEVVRSHVATDNIKAANLAGEYIAGKLNKKGKVLILGGATGSQTADDRQKGVMEAIFRVADWDATKANEITLNVLSATPDLAAVFAACDPMIMTARQAVKSKDLMGKVLLVGFDAIPACLKAIESGEVDATVRQDPERMGREGVELMLKHLKGEQIPRHVPIDAVIIDKSNVAQYLEKGKSQAEK